MAETVMPTTEATVVAGADDERVSYELAFHVLPTVVEGEVPAIFGEIKKIVTDAGGDITDEEAPERFELAYEIEKYVEGKNRKFGSAYFGWVRFKAEPAAAENVAGGVEIRTDILRHLLIRLTREEEANPFRFHEALASEKQVTTIEESGEAKPTDEQDAETDAADNKDEKESDEEKA